MPDHMENRKYYYAFHYWHGRHTASGQGKTYRIAGEVLVFQSAADRDRCCNDFLSQGIRAKNKTEIKCMGHGYVFKEDNQFGEIHMEIAIQRGAKTLCEIHKRVGETCPLCNFFNS